MELRAVSLVDDDAVFGPLTVGQQAIAVDILSQESDFLESFVVKITHLAQDALHVARPLAATGIGYDAIMAEVVAAAHDAHKAAHMGRAHTQRHDVAIGLRGGQLNVHGRLPYLYGCHHLGQMEIAVRTTHEIGVMVLDQVVLHALGHTAQHAENRLGVLGFGIVVGMAALLGEKRVETMIDLVLGILAHRTGIEKHRVGIFFGVSGFVTGHLHDGGNDFGVGYIHLAAISLDIEFLAHSVYAYVIRLQSYE